MRTERSRKSEYAAILSIVLLIFIFFIQPEAGAADGTALYREYCASCHGNLKESNKKGTSPFKIKKAIRNQRKMKSLRFLSDRSIEAIAGVLSD